MPKPARRPPTNPNTLRQRAHVAALNAIAQAHGFPSWGALGTAVKQGRARLTVSRVE